MRRTIWLGLTLAACSGGGDNGGGTQPPPPPTVATVSVALAANSIVVGQTTTAVATARDGAGNTITGRTVNWSSSNTAVATVDANGTVTAATAGSATITATVDNVSGGASLTVTPVPVASVTVTLGAASLFAGQTTQATAVLRDAANNTLTGRQVTWTSSNLSVATVSTAGLVSAAAPGSTNIVATAEGRTGQAALTVSVNPATQTILEITGITANGAPADLAQVAGDITIGLDVTTPPSVGGTLIVTIGGVEFARTTVAPTPAPRPGEYAVQRAATIDLNTSDYTASVTADQITALPLRGNGAHDLIARLEVTVGSQTYSSQQTRQVTLRNVNTFIGVTRLRGNTATVNNRTWEAGDYEVRAAYLNYEGLGIDDIKAVLGNEAATFGAYAGAPQVASVTRSGANPFATRLTFAKSALPGISPPGGSTLWIDSYRQNGVTVDPQAGNLPNLAGTCADLDRDGFADAALPAHGLSQSPGCTRFQRVPDLLGKLTETPMPRRVDATFSYDHAIPNYLNGFWHLPDRRELAGFPGMSRSGEFCCNGNMVRSTFDLRTFLDFGEADDLGSGIDRNQTVQIWVGPQSTMSGIKVPANQVTLGAPLPVTPAGTWHFALMTFKDRVGNERDAWLHTTPANPLMAGGVPDPTLNDLTPAVVRVTDQGGTGAYTGIADGTWFRSPTAPLAFSGTMTGATAGYAPNPFSIMVGYRETANAAVYPLIVQPSFPGPLWAPEIITSTGGTTASGSFPLAPMLAPGFGPGTIEGYYDAFFCGTDKGGQVATGLGGQSPNTPKLPTYDNVRQPQCRELTVALDMTPPTTTNQASPPAQVGTANPATLTATVNDNLAAGHALVGAEYRSFANAGFDAGYVYYPFLAQAYLVGAAQLQVLASLTGLVPWGLYLTNGSGVPPATGFLLSHLYYQALDRAGNASARTSVAVSGLPALPTSPWAQVQDVAVLMSGTEGCTGVLGACGSRPTSTTFTYRVRSASAVAPFLYAMAFAITAQKATRLLCTANTNTVTQVGGVFEYLYACTVNWAMWNLATTGNYQIAMLGVTQNGLALKYGLFLTFALWASQATMVY